MRCEDLVRRFCPKTNGRLVWCVKVRYWVLSKNKMAPWHSGYRAQGQLNANFIVGKFSINVTVPCDDFRIVHWLINSPVSKNVTQGRSNSTCPILKTIPHAILTSSSLKLLFYCDRVFGCYTCARLEITFSSERKGKRKEIPNYQFLITNSWLPLEYSQSARFWPKLDRSTQPRTSQRNSS